MHVKTVGIHYLYICPLSSLGLNLTIKNTSSETLLEMRCIFFFFDTVMLVIKIKERRKEKKEALVECQEIWVTFKEEN